MLKYLKHLYIIEDVTYLKYLRSGSITTGTNLKTRQNHWTEIYYDISNNFTPYDSHREAKFYVRGFCRYYIDYPHNELYREASLNFRKEFSITHDFYECVLLFSTCILSKTKMGRQTFHKMRNIYNLTKQ